MSEVLQYLGERLLEEVSSRMASEDSFLKKNCTDVLSHTIDFSYLAKLILFTENWKIQGKDIKIGRSDLFSRKNNRFNSEK